MKYINFITTVFLIICLIFLTSCSSGKPSQVVLQEDYSEGLSGSGELFGYEGAETTGLGVEPADVRTDSAEMESETDVCYVYICGAVYEPGVYMLPAGSRLYEAVEAAGGFLPEACEEYCNLASVVSDGLQYRIPTTEEVLSGNIVTEIQTEKAAAENGNVSHYDSEGRLDINLATAEELMMLSGIGQSRADAIITYREEHGAFSNKEEIMRVTGIKEGLYSKIEDYIIVR